MNISTNLPDLPRILKKREAKCTPKVLQWFRDNYKGNCAIEIKATDTGSIHKSVLKEHQYQALMDAQGERGIVYKIADSSRRQLPFDAFKLQNTPAFVVACFTNNGICLVIPVNEWNGATPATRAIYQIKL